jgi:ribosome-binding protein aMBF1 (putative translation factor)
MKARTCAACDCELDGSAIEVTLAVATVEVCCEACALKLNEAHIAARGDRSHARDASRSRRPA